MLCQLHATQTFAQPSKNAGLEMGSLRNDLSRLARSPFGGSLVILTPKYHKQQSQFTASFIDSVINSLLPPPPLLTLLLFAKFWPPSPSTLAVHITHSLTRNLP